MRDRSQRFPGPCSAAARYRLCYVRGPEGIIVALAEQLSLRRWPQWCGLAWPSRMTGLFRGGPDLPQPSPAV